MVKLIKLLFVVKIATLLSLSVFADSGVTYQKPENPCFQSDADAVYGKQNCEICMEQSKLSAETDCAEEAKAADALLDSVIYAPVADYQKYYKPWRNLVNKRDHCRIDLLKACLAENPKK